MIRNRANHTESTHSTVDYLVGGLRISLGQSSTTPGPRAHILGFTGALETNGEKVRKILASEMTGMSRFANLTEGTLVTRSSRHRLALADLARVGSSIWCGIHVLLMSIGHKPKYIYERVAVLQSLSSWHLWKNRAIRIIESNGIMSRETANDRKALGIVRIAEYLEKRSYKKADLIVSVSAALADEIVSFAGVDKQKILVVPNAIPDQLINLRNMEPKKKIIGYVGSIVKWQQLDQLITSFSRIDEAKEYTIEIIGEGPEVTSLKNQVKSLGLTKSVRFLGQLSTVESYAHMSRWEIAYSGHIATSSQTMYHSPLKLYEYAGLGLTVVGTHSADLEKLRSDGLRVFEFGGDQLALDQALKLAITSSTDEIYNSEPVQRRLHSMHSWSVRAASVIEKATSLRDAR